MADRAQSCLFVDPLMTHPTAGSNTEPSLVSGAARASLTVAATHHFRETIDVPAKGRLNGSRTDQISYSLLHGARIYAPAAVLLDTDFLELLQAGPHGLKHRIGPVDPLPALAQGLADILR